MMWSYAILFGDIFLALWLLLASPLIIRKLVGDPEQHSTSERRIYGDERNALPIGKRRWRT